jgi:glycosyltransferase involved in cell wall biosynthesis
MGKQIIARFGEKYDFYFVPEGLLERRPDLLNTFISAVDVIHCLNESSIDLFRNVDPDKLPPIVTWIHHVTSWSPQHQLAIERSSALTVCTERWKEYLAARVGPEVPITIVPHGVDLKFFRRREVKPGSFGIPSGRLVVGFIGAKGSDSDRGRKGTDVLLDVVRKAAAQLPKLHVVLGGPGWESELAGLRELGISASATGYIRKSELPALYSALDVYLLTSRVEGGPCTVFEAMACETAVVSTRVGAVPELIIDGMNGYSAEVDDRESLLEAVVTLGRSPEKRDEVRMKGRATVAKLPWGAALDPLESVYDPLVRSRMSSDATVPGPVWMRNPQGVLRTSSAADAVANVIVRMRKRAIGPVGGVKMLFEMLDRRSVSDVVRGIAMLRGLTYRGDISSTSGLV